jgi:CBS domain-containing protein
MATQQPPTSIDPLPHIPLPLYSPYTYSLQQFLKEYKCSGFLFPRVFRSVVTVTPDVTLLDAFQRLLQYRILGVPIIDSTTLKPLGNFGMKDFMNFLVSRIDEKDFESLQQGQLFNLLRDKGLATMQLSSVMKELGRIDPAYTVHVNDSVEKAIDIMAKNNASRVLVVDDQGHLSNVITQFRVIAVITSILDTVRDADKTLKELNLGFKELTTIPDTITAYQAFKVLKEKNLSALPVLDERGTLVGNLSVSDLKLLGFNMEYFTYLRLPVREYLQKLRHSDLARLIESTRLQLLTETKGNPVVTVRPENTFGTTLKLLSLYRVYRVYIVEAAQSKPAGVVALYDILQQIMKTVAIAAP